MGSLNWASGLIPLGRLFLRPLQRHFHSLGLTNRFTPPCRSDPLVLANLLRHWQDPRFLTSGIPIRTFQADFTIFMDASTQGWGTHMGDSQISGTWTHTDCKLHINCLELKAVVSALQHWAPVLPGPPRDHETYLQALGDKCVKLPLSLVHISNSGATSPSGGCSVSGLAGEVNVHVSSIPSAQQSHSEAPVHPGGRGSSHSPLVAKTVVVSTPTSSLCGTPLGLSQPSGSSVPAGSEVCLRRKVVPSARMEALM